MLNAVAESRESTASASRLKVNEIFHSLQGESRTMGIPTVFIRLTGCPLRCQYCDTAYAFTGGEWMTLTAIQQQVRVYDCHYVTVTGGEPLVQAGCATLLSGLCDAGYAVSLETSGALDVACVDPRVVKVMDLKTPGSGEVDKNDYANLGYLTTKDQVKFVIGDYDDYQWSRRKVHNYALTERCEVLFSPVYNELKPQALADWILRDRLAVRFQIQLHKHLWGDLPGH